MSTNVAKMEALLREVNAWQTGHFLLSSGMHSSEYVQCQKLLQYPRYGKIFAEILVNRLLSERHYVSAVVGPALGAVHWELLVAQALDNVEGSAPIKAIFAERPDGTFSIRRGVELAPGEKVLVVEDVTTTGGSARQVVELVRELGAQPVAVGAIIDRSGGKAQFDVPFFSLVKMNLETYPADDCPLCRAGQELVKPGSKKLALG